MPKDLDTYLAQTSAKVRKLVDAICGQFTDEGCSLYVKTIYIGADLNKQMVGAIYAHKSNVEVALALPEDATHLLLEDASHLTWRTLPVLAKVESAKDVKALKELVGQACQRIRESDHDVYLDDDFFVEARRRRGEFDFSRARRRRGEPDCRSDPGNR